MLKCCFLVFGILSGFFIATPYKCHAAATNRPNPFYPPLEQSIAREKPHLVLYYLPWCPYCQKITDYLKQIHRSVPMKNLQYDTNNKEELRKIGGKTQVPCLIINGKAMYESSAILQWLSQNKSILETN